MKTGDDPILASNDYIAVTSPAAFVRFVLRVLILLTAAPHRPPHGQLLSASPGI